MLTFAQYGDITFTMIDIGGVRSHRIRIQVRMTIHDGHALRMAFANARTDSHSGFVGSKFSDDFGRHGVSRFKISNAFSGRKW